MYVTQLFSFLSFLPLFCFSMNSFIFLHLLVGNPSTCNGTACVTVPVTCQASTKCVFYACDPSSGACLPQAVICDDGDLCTADTCDPNSGCKHDRRTCADPTDRCVANLGCDGATGILLSFLSFWGN